MACKKKTDLDRNRQIDTDPDILQDWVQSVFQMLEGYEDSNCESIKSCKQLKTGLETLIDLLCKVQTLYTNSDVEEYLAHLKCLQDQFSAINTDTGWICEKAIGILDKLRTLVRRDVIQSGVMQQKFCKTLASINEPFQSPSYSLTSTIADGYSNNDQVNMNVLYLTDLTIFICYSMIM